MQSPWAGDGRGVVMQKIFSKDGTLLATCVQEVCSLSFCLPNLDLGEYLLTY
jgi:acyl-CoA thioesterase